MTARPLGIAHVEGMVLGTGLLGLFFGAALLSSSLGSYRRPALVVAAFLASGTALAVVVLRASRRGGTLTRTDSVWLGLLLAAVDVAVGLSAREGDARVGAAVWNVGTGALLVLGMAAYRPAREVHVLAGLHAATVLAVAAGPWVGEQPAPAGLWQAAVTSVLPAFAATGFLAEYAQGLRRRDASVVDRLESDAAQRAQEQSGADSQRRLTALDAQLRPLLARVERTGTVSEEDRLLAQQLSRRLREELVAASATSWLALAVADIGGPQRVLVADGADLAGRADVPSQAALVALVRAVARALGRSEPAGRVQVTLAEAGPGAATCVISAPVDVAGHLAHDQEALVAIASLDGTMRKDGGTSVIEGRVRLRSRQQVGSP